MTDGALKHLQAFTEIIKPNEPLAPYTFLKLGGPAEALAQPRNVEELAALVRCCSENRLPLRILGNGCNLLVRDAGVSGVVVRLSEPAFTGIEVQGKTLRAGAGAALSATISHAAHHGLAGLETLVGVPGTIGGALRHNTSDRVAEIGQFVRRVDVIDGDGEFGSRLRDELNFGYRTGNLEDTVIVAAELEMEPDSAEAIVKRLRKAWIQRKADQPPSFQAAGKAFKNPRTQNAASLIEQANLAGTRVGGAQVSERDANYIVVHHGATAHDVLRLIEMIRAQVRERFNVELEMNMTVW